MMNGLLGAVSLRAVFLLDAAALVAVAAVVSRVMVERPLVTEAPPMEDA
jgi:hypothetical protein